MGPAAERGGIGQAIRVFERRGRLFPGVVLDQAPLQGLTTSQQAEVCVRERKRREEGEGLPTTGAETATDPNPVVLLIVRLLAPAPVANDRIVLTNGAAPQDDLGALLAPIGFKLAARGGEWDKQNRSSSGLPCGRRHHQDLGRKRSPFLLKKKIPTGKRITLLGSAF